ncbi:hypothetical protein K439DRAFT_1621168 [Ramaria rubella]|nr:hypothetical protein K439DRAFT_1621168 [Ramaria rubella]
MPMDISTPNRAKSAVQWLRDIQAGTLIVSTASAGSSHRDSLGAKTSTINAGDIIDCVPRSQSPTLTIPHPDDPESAEFWGREILSTPPKWTYVDLDRDDMPAWLHKVEMKCQGWGNGVGMYFLFFIFLLYN